MKSSILLPFFLLAFTGAVNACTKPKSIFILAGKSNMAGRGGVYGEWDRYIPPPCQSSPSILRLNANLVWVVANEPLHQDIDTKKICGVGLGMCFANQVLRQGSSSLGVIGLVPCAVGGTSITQWSRGTPLYNSILERAAAAVRSGGKIEALLWYPGEFEALMGVGSFEEDVPKFFTSIRHDLHMPQLPIIQVAIPPNLNPNFTFAQAIRKIQLNIKLPFVSTVDALGLELKDDLVHMTSSAQVTLGIKMALNFYNMLHH